MRSNITKMNPWSNSHPVPPKQIGPVSEITIIHLLGESTDQNCPLWPDPIITTCMSYLTIGGPGKECRTNKLPPTRRIRERSKGDRRHQYICSPRILLAGINFVWEMCVPLGRTRSQRQSETNPITVKPKTASQVAEQFPWAPLCCCSPPGHLFLIKSLLCQHVRLLR